ncbi:RdgB/HAM1 family non-canonical purine NTP pyrophosphatase [Acuticoccus sp.]|uniref:RdgB/HAM1 family non-canonical purine NTP pyrophosphatase n=1 Tax=Acuticoccus sp. TaxID=1904378 RepID=UPI003B520C96
MSLRGLIGEQLILATHNAGKVAELEALLAPLGIAVSAAAAHGLPEPEESGTTFEENAAIKAETAAAATGVPALADDSGLAVAALDGAPGVHSARWAGPTRDFGAAMARVLEELGDAPSREAAFVTVLALAIPGRPTSTFEGRCEGRICAQPRGDRGFGYDPIFMPAEGDGRTFGEMTADEKSGGAAPLSHRARAVAKFVRMLA